MSDTKNRAKVELLEYANAPDGENGSGRCISYKYHVEQNNGTTSVEQHMLITSRSTLGATMWTASIELDDFPPFRTPAGAAMKLADWLERLAQAIRIGEYQDYSKASFVDIPEK